MISDYKIVEPYLGTYEYDGVRWECFGPVGFDGPEVVQVTAPGYIDIRAILPSTWASLQEIVMDEWLDNKDKEN